MVNACAFKTTKNAHARNSCTVIRAASPSVSTLKCSLRISLWAAASCTPRARFMHSARTGCERDALLGRTKPGQKGAQRREAWDSCCCLPFEAASRSARRYNVCESDLPEGTRTPTTKVIMHARSLNFNARFCRCVKHTRGVHFLHSIVDLSATIFRPCNGPTASAPKLVLPCGTHAGRTQVPTISMHLNRRPRPTMVFLRGLCPPLSTSCRRICFSQPAMSTIGALV